MGAYYLLLSLLLIICTVTYFCSYEKKKLIFTLLTFFILAYFSSIRFNVGYDFGPYASMYQKYSIMSSELLFSTIHEKGYVVLNYFLGFFSPSYRLLFLSTSVLCIAGVCWYLYTESNIVWLSVFLFFILGFYYISLNFIRQFMAAVIVLFALRYINKPDFLKYLIYIFLASTFHMSAIIMIPFFLLLRIRLNNRFLILYLILLIIFIKYSEPIFIIITSFAYKIYNPLSSPEMVKGIPFMYIMPFIIVFLVSLPLRTELYKQNEKNIIHLNCLLFTILFELIALKHGLISRFILFFMIPAMTVLVPNVILIYKEKYVFNEKRKKVGYGILLLTFLLLLANHQYLLNDNYNGVVPYQTYEISKGEN